MTVARAEAPDAVTQHEDQHQLHRQVQRVRADRDDKRRDRVLHAAQVTRARQRHQQRGDAQHADAQVDLCVGCDLARSSEEPDQPTGAQQPERDEHGRDQQRQPEPLHGLVRSLAFVARTEESSDGRRRPVGKEDEDRVAGEEHRRRDGEAAELRRAQVADDRGVGEDVERFGDERAERRDGQPARSPGPEHARSGRYVPGTRCCCGITDRVACESMATTRAIR